MYLFTFSVFTIKTPEIDLYF